MKYKHYAALRWFRCSVAIGFVVNLLFVVPAIVAPRFLESLIAAGTTNTVHWLQNVGVLLAIVTIMYIPAIRDPFRYLFISYLLVGGRFAAGALFLIGVLYMNYPSGMGVLAATDLTLSPIQAILLYFTLRAGDPRSGYGPDS